MWFIIFLKKKTLNKNNVLCNFVKFKLKFSFKKQTFIKRNRYYCDIHF